jgi:hypothetical protein
MSEKLESNSIKANYHLEKLSQIINQLLPKDMELMEEKNKYQELSLNYKELEENYNNLSHNYSELELKYNELKNRFNNNLVLKREIECQTDLHSFNDCFNDRNVCQLFHTFIATNPKSDHILRNHSSDFCFDQQIDDKLDLKSECLSIDEIPDSLENCVQNDSDIKDNDCVIVEEIFSDNSINEVPDSFDNSLTHSPKSHKTFNIRIDKTVNHLNDIKVKAQKYETSIEKKNIDCFKGEKSVTFDDNYDKNNVKKDKIDSFFETKSKSICNGIKVKEKCEINIDKKNINCDKEEKRKAIDGFHEIMKVKKEKSSTNSGSVKPLIDSKAKSKEKVDKVGVKKELKPIVGKSCPIKYVVKTLGPSVRKKEERKKLNGYTCKV